MISEVVIPDLGATGGDVTLDAWLVEPGDSVTPGQPLFVVTTDKATVEVEAFRHGVVAELRARSGEALSPGAVVALLADTREEAASAQAPERSTSREASSAPAPSPPPADRAPTQPTKGRILASPLARRIAKTEGVDLEALTGSGRRGQILQRDVLDALAARRAAPTAPPASEAHRQPLSPMRRAIAERARRSKQDAPHFYATITVDMQSALELRRQAVEWAEGHGWPSPTLTDLCIRATAMSLREFPALNASYDGDAIITYEDINIGVVVGWDEGILIPVIHRADRLNLYTLAQVTRQLKARASTGLLSAHQLSGGTFTLSNLGMYGLDNFTAVLNPPEAGVLALGAVQERPAVIADHVVPRPLMTATLSVDHRVVDGITAARFAETFKDMLENPARLALEAPTEVQS